ncbi:MAG TPA: DUF2147 domain-containing protein [Flavobacteriales bacterium]|jgi:uncharacterized protein (DUF2147 family)|nr:DUF2147 domain-containing protein [Flavobacteriales bacterium]HIN41965.1 DUF2147 domain-containing protein [Flavobacteriales bacterium]
MIQSKHILLLGSLFLVSLFSIAQTSIEGHWKTIDDETGRIKSIVEITERDGQFFGNIVELFRLPDEDQDPHCDKCDDDRKDQRTLGMEIVRNMVLADGESQEWEEGTICDPKKGSIYDCEMWFEDGNIDVLKVRGYIWFVFRTQDWLRVTE